MHIETITFDRVFDIVHRYDKIRGISTAFGFVTNGKKVFSATVDGTPKIFDGMTVTVAISKPEQWGTIYGWVNHTDGTIQVNGGIAELIFGIVMLCMGLGGAYHELEVLDIQHA